MQSNRMWWDKAVCGLAHHPISHICDKGNRTQSLAALKRGGGKKKIHNPTTKLKGWLLLPLVQGWPTWGLILSHRQLTHSSHVQATSQGHQPWTDKMTAAWFTSQLGQKNEPARAAEIDTARLPWDWATHWAGPSPQRNSAIPGESLLFPMRELFPELPFSLTFQDMWHVFHSFPNRWRLRQGENG